MKKIILLLSIIPIVFLSCTKEIDDNKCNCNSGKIGESNLTIDLENNIYSLEGIASKYVYNGNENIAIAITKGNDSFNNLISSFSYTRTIDTGIAMYLYCNKLLNSGDTIFDEDIAGLSTYNVVNNKLFHNVYQKQNNDYNIIYSYETDCKNLQQIKFILNYKLTNGDNVSYVSIIPNNIESFTLNNPCDEFRMIEPDFCYFSLTTSKSTLESSPGPGGCNCGGVCSLMANMKCVESFLFPGEYFCDHCGCAADNQVFTLIDKEAMSSDSVYMAYDTTLQYDLRDEFFVNSEIGVKYTNYYYGISEFLGKESVPVSLMIETAEFLIDFNPKLEMLLDTTGNSNTIFLNSSMKTRLIDIIDDYKALSSNQDYINALNDIKPDINTYSNKSLSYILSNIE